MKSKTIIVVLFVVMVAVQWFVPLQMIRGNKVILSDGKEFKFKLAPVDPEDPFRGKYLNLSYEANRFDVIPPPTYDQGEKVYVHLEADGEGFARIRDLSRREPDEEVDFIQANVQYTMGEDTLTVFIAYPFDRYYLNEKMAGPIERMLVGNQADSTALNYALVRVNAGKAALEELYLDDIPLEEWYQRMSEREVPEKVPQ